MQLHKKNDITTSLQTSTPRPGLVLSGLSRYNQRAMDSYIERLATFPISSHYQSIRDQSELERHLNKIEDAQLTTIGKSREGRALWGLSVGHGERAVSLIAGCHADEPVGPMTAQCLASILRESFPEFLDTFTFHIVPQMNPDGAERNRPWFDLPLDPPTYLEHVIRELPGDDIEFGFGSGETVRPECAAAQSFLAPFAPFAAHFSLHGLGFAEGVWCLICRDWGERSAPFMDAFSDLCGRLDYPQLDIDRKGEKGFHRIRKGFSTTPTSSGMKEFFLAKNDPGMAAKFLPNSMEWAAAKGGDPLCVVSEVPLYTRNASKKDPELDFRGELASARGKSKSSKREALADLFSQFDVFATPVKLQMRLQIAMIILSLGICVQARGTA